MHSHTAYLTFNTEKRREYINITVPITGITGPGKTTATPT